MERTDVRDDRKNADALLDALVVAKAECALAQAYADGAAAIIAELESRVEALDNENTKNLNRSDWYQRKNRKCYENLQQARTESKHWEEMFAEACDKIDALRSHPDVVL